MITKEQIEQSRYKITGNYSIWDRLMLSEPEAKALEYDICIDQSFSGYLKFEIEDASTKKTIFESESETDTIKRFVELVEIEFNTSLNEK